MLSKLILHNRKQLSRVFFILLIFIGIFHIAAGLYFIIMHKNDLMEYHLESDTILSFISNKIGNRATIITFGIIEIVSGLMLFWFYKNKSLALLGITINTILFVLTLSLSNIGEHSIIMADSILKNAILIKDLTLLGLGIILFWHMINNIEN